MAHCRLIVSDHFTRAAGTGEAGGAIATQILADHLILSQLGGKDYTRHITIGTPRFSDLPTALSSPTLLSDMYGWKQNKFALHIYLFVEIYIAHEKKFR